MLITSSYDLMLITDDYNNAQKLVNLIGSQGEDDDILFNAKKSGILSNDLKEPVIKLNGEPMKYENEMRYLGVQLASDGKPTKHVKNRKKKAFSSLCLLRSLGLISNNMSLATKAYLFKVFIRPVIHYGLGVFNLNECQNDEIKSTETIIKQILGINKQIRNTSILSALKIEQSNHNMIKNRINLYRRLLDNDFTSKMIIELNTANKENSFTEEICQLVNIDHPDHLDVMFKTIDDKLTDMVMKEDLLAKSSEVKEVVNILNITNRTIMLSELRKSQGFKNK